MLDIFTSLPPEVDLETLCHFGDFVADAFSERKPRYRFSSNIRVNLEDSSKSSADGSSSQLGWIFRTPDRAKAVQARLDGFSFNRLPIYEGWSHFCSEARTNWNIYRKVATPQFITSVALRYINRIFLPLPFKDFREYCILFPDFPKGIPVELSEFLMRLVGPSTHVSGANSAVTVTFEPPPANRAVLPLILDIHVSQMISALPASDDERVWALFELLREEKNIMFEASITDAARQLFRQ